jgi:hypothetical protein
MSVSLLIFWQLSELENTLKPEPEEIKVTIEKLPEYRFKWRVCLHKHPDIQDHGKAFRCAREDF